MGTLPAYPRLELAEVTAQNILMCTQILKPPVPVSVLLERYSIVHLFDEGIDNGFCFERACKWHVCINRHLPKELANFTAAHELGHLFLNHLHLNLSGLTEQKAHQLKSEADFFADSLLVPKDWVYSNCTSDCVDPDIICCLARLFSVPQTVMLRRLNHLGYCSIGYHRTMLDCCKCNDVIDNRETSTVQYSQIDFPKH